MFLKVAIMLQYSASPRLGHLKGMYHIFGYLKKHEMSRIVFDPKRPDIDETSFSPMTTDWKDFYGGVEEELLPQMPELLGKCVHTTCF